MKNSNLISLFVIVCLVGAIVSSYLLGTVQQSWAVVFGFTAIAFGAGFPVFVAKLTKD